MLSQGLTMDGPQGNQIQSVEEMVGRFTTELLRQIDGWKRSLIQTPGELEATERNVHQAFARGADIMVAGLMAITISGGHLEPAWSPPPSRLADGFRDRWAEDATGPSPFGCSAE